MGDDGADLFDDAIAEAWKAREESGVVLGWFLVVEGLDKDGNRCLNYFSPEGAKTWQVKGYLHSALDSQNAADIAADIMMEGE